MSSNESVASIINDLLEHLTKIVQGTSVLIDYKLIDNASLLLKGEASLYQISESSVLDKLVFVTLSIIKSDNTTSDAKDVSIQVLDCILSHYEFDQILEKFSIGLFIQGLESQKEKLQVLVVGVLSKASPADIVANTPIMFLLVQILNEPRSSIALVNVIEKCVFTLAKKGELIRRRILSDEIISTFRKMKSDSNVAPRLYDIVLKLLPVIPSMPEDLYLITTQAITSSDDVLLDSFTISFYTNLLTQIGENVGLLPILDRLEEQISYISQIFCDPMFKPEIGGGDYLDAALFLCQLSFLSLKKFGRADSSHHILDHATSNYLTHKNCRCLLSNVNPSVLRSHKHFIKDFKLDGITVPIYCNMMQDKQLLLEELPITTTDILKLNVSDFLQIMSSLIQTEHGLHKLVKEWPLLMTNLLDINDVLDSNIWNDKLNVIEKLYKNRNQIGVWSSKIVEVYSLMRNGHAITVEADVKDTMGP